MLDKDCIFCKIIKGEVPSQKVYEDDIMIIIRDIEPKAKNHFLLIPKDHYKLLADMTDSQADILTACIKKIKSLTTELHLTNGFRIIINQGDDAGQTVPHLHIHILSGQPMKFSRV